SRRDDNSSGGAESTSGGADLSATGGQQRRLSAGKHLAAIGGHSGTAWAECAGIGAVVKPRCGEERGFHRGERGEERMNCKKSTKQMVVPSLFFYSLSLLLCALCVLRGENVDGLRAATADDELQVGFADTDITPQIKNK